MESFFGQLYLELADHLKTSVPALRWVDQDFGQLEEDILRPAVAFPCALLDVGEGDFTELATNVQHGIIKVMIRIGFAPYSSSQHGAPASVKEKALEYYNIEQAVYEAVQGWAADFSTPLIRRKVGTEGRNDKMRVRVLIFETSFEDYSAIPQYSRVPRPDLDIEIQTS